jgi:hypothetical protein
VAKRKRQKREVETVAYTDAEGSVLTLRVALSRGTIAKIQRASGRGAGTVEDDWRRRTELLFERLAVSWEIAGLPLEDQKLLLGRYRMADADTQRWVRRMLADHVAAHIPELAP